MSDRKPFLRSAKRWLPPAVLASLIAWAYLAGWHEALSLESLQAQKEQLRHYMHTHPLLAAGLYAGTYSAAVALSLPVATLLTLLGGFLFGKWLGTLLVVSGATAGACIIFAVAKSSLGAALRERAGPLYHRISDNMKDNATGYLFFMRLVPLFPFVLVNIVPALFNVPLRVFVLTTFFGIMPGSFVYVNVGERLAEIESLRDLVAGETLFAFALLGVFALLPSFYKQWKRRKHA